MSEAPERIWAWWDDEYDAGLVNTHGDKRYTPAEAREYVRADRIEHLEEALKNIRDVAEISEGTQWYAMIAEKALTGEKSD